MNASEARICGAAVSLSQPVNSPTLVNALIIYAICISASRFLKDDRMSTVELKRYDVELFTSEGSFHSSVVAISKEDAADKALQKLTGIKTGAGLCAPEVDSASVVSGSSDTRFFLEDGQWRWTCNFFEFRGRTICSP
jgi:hypothetical protein